MRFENLTFGEQVHSTGVTLVDEVLAGRGHAEDATRIPATDALITKLEDVPLAVLTADCVPVLFADPATGAVAAVHAGWRGITAGIIERTIDALVGNFGVERRAVKSFVGPAIGACCYEIGDEVVSRLTAGDLGCITETEGRTWLNLKACCAGRMEKSGLDPANIFTVDACTRCMPELLFSHRRDGADRGSNISIVARLKESGTRG